MALIIQGEQVSKAYQIGEFSTGTISKDIERAWYRLRGKEDPFLKIGEINDRAKSGNSDVVWSLKDVSFNIEQGDTVGVIGRNGAGKSTLLKILSRVTSPSSGRIKVKGSIASLLEVGTGFHPELTGRENIYLNGAILGMRRAEIRQRFDEIVSFAGVERYLDTPVKRYSSGMYVRLAFAVAAHLDSEILIIDEVLAVGDAEFQQKCLGKMSDVSTQEGRTVLFVSHNMTAVRQLCRKGMLLHHGRMLQSGAAGDIIQAYQRQSVTGVESQVHFLKDGKHFNKKVEIHAIEVNGQSFGTINLSETTNSIRILMELTCLEDSYLAIEANIKDGSGTPLAAFSTAQKQSEVSYFERGKHLLEETILLPDGIMKGDYYFSLFLTHPGYEFYFSNEDAMMIAHEGFTTKSGKVLEYKDGHGWLLLS